MRLSLILLALTIPASAETQTWDLYGPQGQYLGSATQSSPSAVYFYGPQGQYQGEADRFPPPPTEDQ